MGPWMDGMRWEERERCGEGCALLGPFAASFLRSRCAHTDVLPPDPSCAACGREEKSLKGGGLGNQRRPPALQIWCNNVYGALPTAGSTDSTGAALRESCREGSVLRPPFRPVPCSAGCPERPAAPGWGLWVCPEWG